MPEFPCFFRPLIGYSYSHGGGNMVRKQIPGGSSRVSMSYLKNKILFDVQFVIATPAEMQIFNDWFFNTVAQGTEKFKMNLKPTGLFEECICIIVPGSVNVSSNKPFNVSFSIEVEGIQS